MTDTKIIERHIEPPADYRKMLKAKEKELADERVAEE